MITYLADLWHAARQGWRYAGLAGAWVMVRRFVPRIRASRRAGAAITWDDPALRVHVDYHTGGELARLERRMERAWIAVTNAPADAARRDHYDRYLAALEAYIRRKEQLDAGAHAASEGDREAQQ